MKRLGGFTIVEMMITVMVLGLLLTIGVPSFRTMLQNNRQTSNANAMVASLVLARSEAIKRNAPVSLRALVAGGGCRGDPALTDFAAGWDVFVDLDGDGTPDAPELLSSQQPLTGGESSFCSEAGELFYRADGTASTGGGIATTARFSLYDSRGDAQARHVYVGLSGRPYVVK
jgi:type IV fimbrial biogenesis protein FimT